MNLLNFALLIFAHYLLGWSVLKMTGVWKHGFSLQYMLVSVMIGVGLSCLFPVILEVGGIAITKTSLSVMIAAVSAVPLILWIMSFRNMASPVSTFRRYQAQFRLYDLAFLAVFCYIMYVSAFKCMYYPPTPRDLTSGAEAIAEYTIKEHHINNSYFTIDLSSTDNHQKPPFLLGLQIIYKSFVQPFGQVWLLLYTIPFFLFLYIVIRRMVHPVIAAVATLLVLCTPELYGYTIMPLFDLPNMVYLFIAFYYLYCFLKSEKKEYLFLSIAGLTLGTLVRPETLVLTVLVSVTYYIRQMIRKKKLLVFPALQYCFLVVLIPLAVDLLTMEVFVKHTIPASLNIAGKFNPDLTNFQPLFDRWTLLFDMLMFNHRPGGASTPIWYAETFNFMVVFILMEVLAIIITRKISFDAACWFIFMLLVFVLLGLIGYLLLWTEFTNAKRGLFKLIPLIYVFGIHTRPVQFLSAKLTAWEG